MSDLRGHALVDGLGELGGEDQVGQVEVRVGHLLASDPAADHVGLLATDLGGQSHPQQPVAALVPAAVRTSPSRNLRSWPAPSRWPCSPAGAPC
jgi:hypothetical protein